MGRVHLFEFEDQGWFPGLLRDYMTDYLQFIANRMKLMQPVVPVLETGLEKTGQRKIIDLASGGGGPWLSLAPVLKARFPNLTILLTDFFPNTRAFQSIVERGGSDTFSYSSASVDARAVPENLDGFRTQFLSFHHFRPEEARQILQNAVNARQGIGIFEAQERSIGGFIQFFFSPIFVILLTPFIRPFSWGRLLFTYLIPLLPFFIWFDGLVSVLRTYSVKEMNAMVNELEDGTEYKWEVGVKVQGPNRLPYLVGYPRSQS